MPQGDVDLAALRAAVGPKTAGIMLTNPSTLGVFERQIDEVARIVHEAGGLLYYDGANLNAILGKVRPGDMGFDVIHMNLHKTFSTPHGGGGPGAGAVGRGPAAAAVHADSGGRRSEGGTRYRWLDERGSAAVDRPAVGIHRQRRRAAARLRLHAHARPRRACSRVGEYRDPECELPARASAAGRLRCRLSEAPRQPRVHPHAQAPGPRAGRDGHGLRQAAARLRLSRARPPTSRCWCPSAC